VGEVGAPLRDAPLRGFDLPGQLGALAAQGGDGEVGYGRAVRKTTCAVRFIGLCGAIAGEGGAAMAGTPRRERLLHNIEAELSLLECLVGHVAAEAALGSARGLTVEAEEARAVLAVVADARAQLRGLRDRLRRGQARRERADPA
jgi:hypothetical protein